MTPKEQAKQLIEEFESLSDWNNKYGYLFNNRKS